MPAFLDDGLLQRFEARLEEAGAGVVGTLAPGLTDAEIDALLVPVGIDLPEEARRLWRWHDGHLASPSFQLAPDHYLMAVADVAKEWLEVGEEVTQLYGVDKLVNALDGYPAFWFGCAGPRDAPVPVYSQNDYAESPRLVLPSIGELVLAFIALIDRGVWRTGPDGHWLWDHENIPEDVLAGGIY